jgi:hypothetical protein
MSAFEELKSRGHLEAWGYDKETGLFSWEKNSLFIRPPELQDKC